MLFHTGSQAEQSKECVWEDNIPCIKITNFVLRDPSALTTASMSVDYIDQYTMSMKKTYVHLGSNALLSSTIFFIVTNFAVWMSGTMYPPTLDGLILCYTMAIPFFGNTLAGTLFYVSLLSLVSYSATNISRRYTDDEETITSSLNIIVFPHRVTGRAI